MKNKIIILIFFTFLFLFSKESNAQLFTVKVTDYGGIEDFALLKRIVDERVLEFQNKVNDEYPSKGPDRIMKGMANSSVMASKGIGKDYASEMNLYLIGAGVGLAADLEHDETTDSDVSGIGAATGLVIGTKARNLNIQKLGGLDTSKLSLYTNFMKLGHDQEVMNNGGVESDLHVDLLNLGLHFKYDWLPGSGDQWLGWGGVKLHWGYEYNRTKFILNNEIDKVFSASSDQDNINGRITGSPKYEILAQTHSVPLEISSDVRFLNIFTLFGGLGTDINYGKATGKGLLNGDVTPLLCTGTGVCGGGRIIKVQVQANLDAEGKVNPLMLRGFTGLQLNLPYFRVFGQVDKAFGTELMAISAGLRFVY